MEIEIWFIQTIHSVSTVGTIDIYQRLDRFGNCIRVPNSPVSVHRTSPAFISKPVWTHEPRRF